MTVLETRLRRTRRQCAERRGHLADLEVLAQRLCGDAQRVRNQIEQAGPAADATWPLIQRYGKLERSIADLEDRVVAARAALAASEQELNLHERASAYPGIRRRG